MANLHDLVSAEDLAGLEGLELLASRLVNGFLTGRHDSRRKGGCSEFAEHRAYTPGDELRRLDWRIAAKSDRHFIKQFHEESNLSALLVVDASASMAFSVSTRTKLLHARAAAACLGRLLLGQGDAVGLAVAAENAPGPIPPRASAKQLDTLLASLAALTAAGANTLPETLRRLLEQLRRPAHLVVLSDGLVELDALARILPQLAARGHRLLFLQVLAPEELHFPFEDPMRFESLEEPSSTVDVDPRLIAPTYLERLRLFLESLRRLCLRTGGEHHLLPTDQALGESLAPFLFSRSRRQRGAHTRQEPTP
jgi:uncharacterized protein (DUF58 family)